MFLPRNPETLRSASDFHKSTTCGQQIQRKGVTNWVIAGWLSVEKLRCEIVSQLLNIQIIERNSRTLYNRGNKLSAVCTIARLSRADAMHAVGMFGDFIGKETNNPEISNFCFWLFNPFLIFEKMLSIFCLKYISEVK